MQVTSSSIVGGKIEKQHACSGQGGTDTPIQLSISGVPAAAKFIAIVADDPDAVKPAGKVWVHWNMFNVPASRDVTIEAGQNLTGDAGRTTGGAKAYEGPCPPDGTHTYRFAVFAYQQKLEAAALQKPMTIDDFESKFGGRVLARAMVTGQFG